jgi:hypothetical protein
MLRFAEKIRGKRNQPQTTATNRNPLCLVPVRVAVAHPDDRPDAAMEVLD